MSIAPIVVIPATVAKLRLSSVAGLLLSPLAGALLLTVVALLAMPVGAQNGGVVNAFAPPRVGVVDIGKVVDQYPLYIKLRGDLDKQVDAYLARREAATKRLREMLATVQVLDKNAPERKNAEFQLNLERQTQEFQQKSFQEEFGIAELRMMLRVYEDLDFAIDHVAKKKGIGLVMPKRDILVDPNPIAEQQPGVVQDRVSAYQRRTVWFASGQVDMTADLIKYMMTPLPDRKAKERAFLMQKAQAAPRGAAGAGGKNGGAAPSKKGG